MNKKDLPATKGDLIEFEANLEKKFATKDDLAGLEARMDGKFASKDDMVTVKGDIARLDAKTDRIAAGLVRTQDDVREIKATMSTKDDIERVLRHVDGFAAQAIHYARADATRGQALIKVEVMADDHERRISALEAAKSRPPAP